MGLGQFYSGHFWRATVWFFGSILIVVLLTVLTGIGGFIVAPFLWIGCAWDAYKLAK
jgi:hypothetical protein